MENVQERKPLVSIIDDDALLIKLTSTVLAGAGMAIRSHVSPKPYLDAYDPGQPGCIVSDIHMPEMTGLQLQEQLNLMGAVTPVIFLTGTSDVSMAVEAMRHGAFDFLEKPVANQGLIDCVKRALDRDAVNRQELAQLGRIRTRYESLTPRENDVYRLLAEGLANKQIAAALNIAGRTVELYRARVMEKMNVRSLAQLLRMRMELLEKRR